MCRRLTIFRDKKAEPLPPDLFENFAQMGPLLYALSVSRDFSFADANLMLIPPAATSAVSRSAFFTAKR